MVKQAARPNFHPVQENCLKNHRSVDASHASIFLLGPVKNCPVCQYGIIVMKQVTHSRRMPDAFGVRKAAEARDKPTQTKAQTASKLIVNRRWRESGTNHAEIAIAQAKPP